MFNNITYRSYQPMLVNIPTSTIYLINKNNFKNVVPNSDYKI